MKRILCENQVITSDQKINLEVDFDSVLLYKSISALFWPILCCFHKLPSLIVGIYYGNKKWSNVKEFVLEFFTKYRNLQNVDIEFRGVKLRIFYYASCTSRWSETVDSVFERVPHNLSTVQQSQEF